jgi:hypothetical protein
VESNLSDFALQPDHRPLEVGIAVGDEDWPRASFVYRLIAMRSKPRCGNPVATY